LWDSQDRAVVLPFICERSPWTIEPTTHHAYLTISGRARATHDNASAACAALPGAPHLVAITDDAEQTAVDAITGATQTYIGLTDRTTEGTYEWEGGEPFSFFAWDTGEPTGVAAESAEVVEGLERLGDCLGVARLHSLGEHLGGRLLRLLHVTVGR
jgi:hypothetical protein